METPKQQVWKKSYFSIRNVIAGGAAALGGWHEAQLQRQIAGNANHEGAKWGKLGVGRTKVNMDGVATDWSPFITEAVGVHEAMFWAKEKVWSRTVVETYALLVVIGI
ncbi:unnamed protein product [Cuscuta europaea]|uniref:Uncharacterized protein n=1 Tax=Cuscuta europaea TaxID=41803 RepID=A0A9P0ZHF7_CUSEU|nr:unnamed protein product [Cuscuta europaea]